MKKIGSSLNRVGKSCAQNGRITRRLTVKPEPRFWLRMGRSHRGKCPGSRSQQSRSDWTFFCTFSPAAVSTVPVNRFVVCAGTMSYVGNNVGHRARRYEDGGEAFLTYGVAL